VDEQVKSERLSRFQKRQDEICLEQNSLFVGKKLPVMIEKMSESGCVGRSESNHIVHFANTTGDISCSPGTIVCVAINHAGQHSLGGDLIP
jgi:tRNA-2-methylthio-N6-dimethylallyladenosine synthase